VESSRQRRKSRTPTEASTSSELSMRSFAGYEREEISMRSFQKKEPAIAESFSMKSFQKQDGDSFSMKSFQKTKPEILKPATVIASVTGSAREKIGEIMPSLTRIANVRKSGDRLLVIGCTFGNIRDVGDLLDKAGCQWSEE